MTVAMNVTVLLCTPWKDAVAVTRTCPLPPAVVAVSVVSLSPLPPVVVGLGGASVPSPA